MAILQWTTMQITSYNTSIEPQPTSITTTTQAEDNTNIRLKIAYNQRYTVNIFASRCGRHSTPAVIELSYSELLSICIYNNYAMNH